MVVFIHCEFQHMYLQNNKSTCFFMEILNTKQFFYELYNATKLDKQFIEDQFFVFPSVREQVELEIYEIRYSSRFELTYILAFNNKCWIDSFDLEQYKPWTLVISNKKYLNIPVNECFNYEPNGNISPVWITGGMSRGSHSFHFGHFSSDHLPAIHFAQTINPHFVFIQAKQSLWQKSLLNYSGIKLNTLELCEPIRSILKYPHVTKHTICASVFMPVLNLNTTYSRRILFSDFLKFRSPKLEFESKKITEVSINTHVVFLSRSSQQYQRIMNENQIEIELLKIFKNVHFIKPEDYDSFALMSWIDKFNPIIISAASSALDPILLLCKQIPRTIIYYSSTIYSPTFTYNDIYALLGNLRNKENIIRIFVDPIYSSGFPWNDEFNICCKSLREMLEGMQHTGKWNKSV